MQAMDIAQLALMGFAIGCVYALVALGFVMIYLAVGALNFAQGELLMVGAYLAIWGYQTLGAGLAGAIAISLVGAAFIGAVFHRVAYYPLRQKPFVTVIISTIAMSIMSRHLALIVSGPNPTKLPPLFGREIFRFGSANLPSQRLAIIIIMGVLLVCQYLFLRKTRLGKMMQATAQDQEGARLAGIPVDRMHVFTFMFSAGLAAVAGILVAPIFFVYPDMGVPLLIKGWMGVVIGGFGSIPGAVVGGIIVGLLETFTAALISSDFKDAITMAVLVAFLIFRPEGVFGEEIAEKV